MGSARFLPIAILGTFSLAFVASAAPPSPLDALDPKAIPPEDRTAELPKGAVAVLGSSRARHAREAKCIAVSPDGRWVASGSRDQTLRLWDPGDLRSVQVMEGHHEDVYSVAFSGDSRTLYSYGWDGCLRIWRLDGARWNQAGVHQLSDGHAHSLLTPDGKLLVVSQVVRTTLRYSIGVYRLHDGAPQLIKRIDGGDDAQQVALSSDGNLLAGSGESSPDNTIQIWDLSSPKDDPRWKLPEPQRRINSLTFAPDGKALFVGTDAGTIVRWLLGDAEPRRAGETKAHKENVSFLTFAPKGSKLFSGSYDATVKAWDWRNGDLANTATLAGHAGWIGGIAFGPDGKTVFTASWDQTLRRWNDRGGKYEAMNPTQGHRHPLSALAFSPDGKTLASGSWTEIGELNPPNEVKLWRLGGPAPVSSQTLTDCTGNINSVAFSSDGKILAAAHGSGVACWETATWRKTATISHDINDGGEVFHAPAEALAFAPDRPLLATGWGAEHMRVTDLSGGGGRTIGQSARLSYHAVGLAFLLDGRRLAAGATHGGHVLVLDPTSKDLSEMRKLPGFGTVEALQVSPDGKFLASADGGEQVRIWDLSDLDQQPVVLKGHESKFAGAVFGDTGRVIAAGDADGNLFVWDMIKRTPILTQRMPARIWRLAMAPDGKHLAVGCGSGLGYILRFDWEKLRMEMK